ncbi:MAG: hypothetical protein Q4B70_19370 [Lachnospiraceae bacterium]|nr:hypothetical protein [Lachnospiraceae bacterium]
MNKILDIIFPFYENRKAKKIIEAKMFPKNEQGEDITPTGILEDIENSDKISTEKLKELYDNTFKTKDKLEDKAKTNIIGITISVSLIIGASGLLSAINIKFGNSLIALCAIIFLIAGVTYMILAGLLVIHVLIGENETYNVNLSSIANGEKLLQDDYDKCIAQNQRKNIIRNNYVFTSYACIRNSLACLFIILLFIAIPNNLSSKCQSDALEVYSSQTYAFSFTSSTIDYLKENDVRDVVERAVISAMKKSQSNESDGTFSIIDESNMLFIKYEVSGNSVKILLLEPYTIK